ncbi:MAG: hypothetical protein KTR33_13890 [Gammaproteobacteria bacterium]|nr:hypothetical protein [Gammaproteobacteria bacterium]
MANTNYAITPILGVDFDARDTIPEFAIGTSIWLNNGDQAQYVQANGAIAASQTDIAVTAAGQASDGLGSWENSATAFADNEYGWVRLNRAT